MLAELERVRTLSDVPFGRNKLLAGAGAALFAATAKLVAPDIARADPFCCSGGACACCNGTSCCNSGCHARSDLCFSGWQCWVCCLCLTSYQCCDYYPGSADTGLCVCAATAGGCGC